MHRKFYKTTAHAIQILNKRKCSDLSKRNSKNTIDSFVALSNVVDPIYCNNLVVYTLN